MNGNDENTINKYMNEYQKIRNKDFMEDIKKIKSLYIS